MESYQLPDNLELSAVGSQLRPSDDLHHADKFGNLHVETLQVIAATICEKQLPLVAPSQGGALDDSQTNHDGEGVAPLEPEGDYTLPAFNVQQALQDRRQPYQSTAPYQS